MERSEMKEMSDWLDWERLRRRCLGSCLTWEGGQNVEWLFVKKSKKKIHLVKKKNLWKKTMADHFIKKDC